MRESASSSDHEAFALRLVAARKIRFLGQTDMAAQLGISLQRYQAWEHARSMPDGIELHRKLCRHLGVTVNWLYFGDTGCLTTEAVERLTDALVFASAEELGAGET